MLGSTNISVMLVKNAIGSPYYSVGQLVSRAKVGGIEGHAFEVKENTTSGVPTGYLIIGAEPYWNLFSNNAPGAWENVGDPFADNAMRYRLHYDPQEDGTPYKFKIGYFRNYNPDAKAPTISDTLIDYNQVHGGGLREYTKPVAFNVGDYDWTKIGKYVALYSFDVDSNRWKIASDPVDITTQKNGHAIMKVTINEGIVSNYTIRLKLMLGTTANKTDFDPIASLPTEGTLTVKGYALSRITFLLRAKLSTGGNRTYTVSDAYYDTNSTNTVRGQATITTAVGGDYFINKATVRAVNSDGVTVIDDTLTPSGRDAPLTLSKDLTVGSKINAVFDWSNHYTGTPFVTHGYTYNITLEYT